MEEIFHDVWFGFYFGLSLEIRQHTTHLTEPNRLAILVDFPFVNQEFPFGKCAITNLVKAQTESLRTKRPYSAGVKSSVGIVEVVSTIFFLVSGFLLAGALPFRK